ncbi:MAG: hypothetical protein WC713_10105 [Candidatus Methylomirabilota bacterium]
MTGTLSTSLASLLGGVRDGRSAFLMDADGVLVAASGDSPAIAEPLAGEYVGVLREAASLCEAEDWGTLRALAVRGRALRAVLLPASGGLVIGLTGGPASLLSQLRQTAGAAAPAFRNL